MHFTPEDHRRISAAIAKAEAGTSGEIFCVISRQVSTYRDIRLAWAAAASLVLPAILIPLGLSGDWFGFSNDWQVAHAASQSDEVNRALTAYALAQVITFIGVYLLSKIPFLGLLMVPHGNERPILIGVPSLISKHGDELGYMRRKSVSLFAVAQKTRFRRRTRCPLPRKPEAPLGYPSRKESPGSLFSEALMSGSACPLPSGCYMPRQANHS